MGLIRKFLDRYKRVEEEKKGNHNRPGQFMPEPEIPIEDKFLINFKENGGKFLYSTDFDEALSNFNEILRENNWNDAYCRSNNLKSLFKDLNVKFSTDEKSSFGILSCEFLVADTGAILVSSNQIGEKKLSELPHNLVIYASVGQLVNSVGDGLQKINMRRQKIPSNITTIKNFSTNQKQSSHFMNYGSCSKNIYLILLEDF